MSERRPPKKSAMLEVRLSHEAKEALMARCRAQGVSASEFVRAHVERFLADGPGAAETGSSQEPLMSKPSRHSGVNATFRHGLETLLNLAARPRAALAALGVTLGLVMIASPSVATQSVAAMFARFDENQDGALQPGEFQIAAAGDTLIFTPTALPEPMIVPLPCPEPPTPPEPPAFTAPPEPPMPPSAQELGDAEFQRLSAEFERAARVHAEEAQRLARTHAEMAAHQSAAHRDMFRASFDGLDQNSDGRLTAEELGERGPPMQAELIVADLDQDDDGAVTWPEFVHCP